MLLLRKISLTLLLAALTYNVTIAQESKNIVPEKTIALKIAALTVDQGKLLSAEFSKPDGYKMVYTCIPAGIVVIISNQLITAAEKEIVAKKILGINAAVHYEILEGYTQQQAEQACSQVRGSKYQNNKLD